MLLNPWSLFFYLVALALKVDPSFNFPFLGCTKCAMVGLRAPNMLLIQYQFFYPLLALFIFIMFQGIIYHENKGVLKEYMSQQGSILIL